MYIAGSILFDKKLCYSFAQRRKVPIYFFITISVAIIHEVLLFIVVDLFFYWSLSTIPLKFKCFFLWSFISYLKRPFFKDQLGFNICPKYSSERFVVSFLKIQLLPNKSYLIFKYPFMFFHNRLVIHILIYLSYRIQIMFI